jgi:flagellar FliL protein
MPSEKTAQMLAIAGFRGARGQSGRGHREIFTGINCRRRTALNESFTRMDDILRIGSPTPPDPARMAKTAKKDEGKKPDKQPEAEAADASEAAAAEPQGKRLSGKKLVLFIILPALLGVGAVGGATWFLFLRGSGHAEEAQAVDPHAPPVPAAVFMNLPEMIVNLNSGGRRANFLKINIALEVANAADVPRIEAVMPRIVDNFQIYLRELRVEDLRGSAGMFRLREELLARVNTAAQPARINDVLFREMLVQ